MKRLLRQLDISCRARLVLLAGLVSLSGCSLLLPSQSAPTVEIEPETGIEVQHGQFQFALPSGRYRCEEGLELELQREHDQSAREQISLQWQGKHYLLLRDPSSSGLPRFEDAGKSLVWIDLPWKGLLLNARSQAPIASECQAA